MKLNSDQFHIYFGLCIAKRRQELGISQAKAAEMIDVSLRHYSDVESGRANLRIDTMYVAARALSLSVDKIMADFEARLECQLKESD